MGDVLEYLYRRRSLALRRELSPSCLFSRRTSYGPLPTELALCGDAGTAWTSGVKPMFVGGDRDWVRSLGVAIRVNALGFAVIELDCVRPLDRPRRGWIWQFFLTQGL